MPIANRAFALAVLALATPSSAGALPLPGAEMPYTYVSRRQELRDALMFFGRNARIATDVDPDLKGDVEQPAGAVTRQAYLAFLSSRFDFVWYFDGITLHIVKRNNLISDTIVLSNRVGADVLRELQETGVYEERFNHLASPTSRVLFVTGPKVYVTRLRAVAKDLDKASVPAMMIMRGRVSTEQSRGTATTVAQPTGTSGQAQAAPKTAE